MIKNVYLDCETQRFFSDPDIASLPRSQQIPALAHHFGLAVTFSQYDGYRTWLPQSIQALWAYLVGTRIIGWNIVHFDIPLIQTAAALAGYPDPGLDLYYALDLFAEIRTRTSRWYKLEDVAQANLGRGKIGSGQQAAEWLRSGDPELARRAAEYCALDVQLTIELHQIAQTSGLLLPARAKDLPGTYRYWVNADGSCWKLADEATGVVLDQEG